MIAKVLAFTNAMLLATVCFAQDPCCRTYRLVLQTVYDQQQVTAYRIENELVYEDQKQTVYRPVYETEYRERRYNVMRPVMETSEREERYRVMRPVWETQMRDTSYDVTRCVAETAEREERYVVARPVYETQEREERCMVQRPVVETAERDECTTVMEPVTTYQTNYVDQGGFVDQQRITPGPTRTRLKWLQAGCLIDPATGASKWQRGGLAWVPEQCPARVETFRVWQPNVVAQQVPQTTFVQKVVTRKVPIQVTRMVNEEIVKKVPMQVCRMVQEEQVRRVPVTTYKQVVERVPQQTPVQVCKMVEEECVRRIPVTTCRMVCEERVDQIPVQVCKMVATEQCVRVPHVVEKRVPVTYTRCVPRTVAFRVPCDPCDPCCDSGVIVAQPGVVAPTITTPAVPYGAPRTLSPQPTPAQPRSGGAAPSQTPQGDDTGKPQLRPEEKVGPSADEVSIPEDTTDQA